MKVLILSLTIILGFLAIVECKPKLGLALGGTSPGSYAAWENWLNTPVEYGLQSIGWQGWYEIEGPNWLLGPFSQWVNSVPANQNRTFVCSIPMITQTNTTLEQGAAGKYNSTWYKLANLLKSYNLTGNIHGAPKTILRFGWEFDGLFPWSVKEGQQTAFITYWRIMTEIFRSIDPTFQTMWNGQAIWNTIDPFSYYPGDAYVDYVAIDIYDRYWIDVIPYNIVSNKRGEWNSIATYAINDTVDYFGAFWQAAQVSTNQAPFNGSPYWKLVATPTQLYQGRVQGWNQMYTNGDNNFKTLTKWSDFARNHSKPVVLQEWAGSTGSRGGGDNTYFIQQIYNWANDPVNNVAWQSWYYGGDQEFFIFSSNQTYMNLNLELKNVSALFKNYFGTQTTSSTSSTSGATTTSEDTTTTDVSTTTLSGTTALDNNGTTTEEMTSHSWAIVPSLFFIVVSLFLLK